MAKKINRRLFIIFLKITYDKGTNEQRYLERITVSIIFYTECNLGPCRDSIAADSTTTVTVALVDSEGHRLPAGSLRYKETGGGWQTAVAGRGADFTIQTSASSLTYQMRYAHSTHTKTDVPVTGQTVTFQTVDASLQLKNSAGDLFGKASVEYYPANGSLFFFMAPYFRESHYFGMTVNGVASKELLPGKYLFKMTYNHASHYISGDIGPQSIVTFTTVRATVQLQDIDGRPVSGARVRYRPVDWFSADPAQWHAVGVTEGGEVSGEFLPRTHAFEVSYGGYSNQKRQHVGRDPVVVFASELPGSEAPAPTVTLTQPADSLITNRAAIAVVVRSTTRPQRA